MSFSVISLEADWKKALSKISHDWYHTWDYHQLANKNGEGKPALLYYENEDQKIVFPILLRPLTNNLSDATSVYGYAGILTGDTIDETSFQHFFKLATEWLKSQNVVTVFSRMHPIYNEADQFLPEILTSLSKTISIDLSLSDEAQVKAYRNSTKREIKKLRKSGAYCRYGNDLLGGFMQVYNQTMDRLEATNYYYFDLDYYQTLLVSKEFESRVYSVFDADDTLMCAGIFMFTGDIVQYHLGGTHTNFLRQAPVKFMLDQVRIDAANTSCKLFHLGGGSGSQEDSLFNFKLGFSKLTHDFNVMKWIVDEDKYTALNKEHQTSNPDKTINTDYFPVYRQ
jgi:hypothetical protein